LLQQNLEGTLVMAQPLREYRLIQRETPETRISFRSDGQQCLGKARNWDLSHRALVSKCLDRKFIQGSQGKTEDVSNVDTLWGIPNKKHLVASKIHIRVLTLALGKSMAKQ
jgi:hypothetical protein